jgi:hypothetical protein
VNRDGGCGGISEHGGAVGELIAQVESSWFDENDLEESHPCFTDVELLGQDAQHCSKAGELAGCVNFLEFEHSPVGGQDEFANVGFDPWHKRISGTFAVAGPIAVQCATYGPYCRRAGTRPAGKELR